MIDLRSDTVTQPTPMMRQAMSEAAVGDDVYGEDPTVNALEEKAAKLMGKESAMLVASGTMGNLVAGLTHCQRGTEMIVGTDAHIFMNEAGSVATLGGIQVRNVPNDQRGLLNINTVESAIRPPGIHFPKTALICLENTHNRGNGSAFTVQELTPIIEVGHAQGIPIHLDGARIFNAAIALQTAPDELVKDVDSLSFCLSKGLSCPVGSIVCGTQEFIDRARGVRKLIGGAMRQAGVIAAAGLIALDTMVERLGEDHANARILANGLSQIAGLSIDPIQIQTNIVYADLPDINPKDFTARLKELGVLANGSATWVRFVTHRGITTEDIQLALSIIDTAVSSLRTN